MNIQMKDYRKYRSILKVLLKDEADIQGVCLDHLSISDTSKGVALVEAEIKYLCPTGNHRILEQAILNEDGTFLLNSDSPILNTVLPTWIFVINANRTD